MSELDGRIRRAVAEIVEAAPPDPPYPLDPFRSRKEEAMSRANLVVAAAAVAVVVAALAVPALLDRAGGAPTLGARPRAETVIEVEGPREVFPTPAPPAGQGRSHAVIVGVGPLAEEALQAIEWDASRTGTPVDVQSRPTERDVLDLLEGSGGEIDVIEVGFRPELLAGRLNERFLPVDPALVPALSRIHPELRLPHDRGIATGVAGLFGLVFDGAAVASPPSSWADLAEWDGPVFLPAPESPLAALFVLEAGGGDADVGIELYLGLVEEGAVLVDSTTDLVEALEGEARVGAWTSSGAWLAAQPVPTVRFLAPAEGAPVLPTFSGILTDAGNPTVGMQWLELRLGEDLQRAVAEWGARAEALLPSRLGLGPAVSGIGLPDDFDEVVVLEREPLATAVDWAAYDRWADRIGDALRAVRSS